jgi:hypothetical protein
MGNAMMTAVKMARVTAIAGRVRRIRSPAVTPRANANAAYPAGAMPERKPRAESGKGVRLVGAAQGSRLFNKRLLRWLRLHGEDQESGKSWLISGCRRTTWSPGCGPG